MYVLCINTSTFALSLGIVASDTGEIHTISETVINTGKPHSEDLIPILDFILKNARISLEDIDAITICIGPGSFTGLRIGLAFAKGLAYSIKKPLIGIPTLDALANSIQVSGSMLHVPCFHITPMMDTKRGEVYTATYTQKAENRRQKTERITEYEVVLPEALMRKLKGKHIFLGDGAGIYRSLIKEKMGENAHFIDPNIDFPTILSIGMLGVERLSKKTSDDIDSLEPLYIYPPKIRKKDYH